MVRRRRNMNAGSPLAAILGAVGGGFQGYADANQRRDRTARMDREEERTAMLDAREGEEIEDRRTQRGIDNMYQQHQLDTVQADQFNAERDLETDMSALDKALAGDRPSQARVIARGHARVPDFQPRPDASNTVSADTIYRQEQDTKEAEDAGNAYIAAFFGKHPEFTEAYQNAVKQNPQATSRPGLIGYRVAGALGLHRADPLDLAGPWDDGGAEGAAPYGGGTPVYGGGGKQRSFEEWLANRNNPKR